MAIRYPTNYDKIADIPADLEDMAESIQDELDLKVNKVTGKGLSTEDYTTAEKTKLDGIESGAEVNVIEDVKVNGISLTPSSKAVDVPVPTKTSDLTNDSGFIDKDVNNLTNYYDKNAVDTKISAVYKYKGTVSTYNDLPSTNLTIGDVYNIETADSTHGVKAGDNVAWNGTAWDVLAGTVDLSGYQTKIDSSHKLESDLVDDTNSTHKFVTSEEKTQISTNATDIDNIKDGTEIDSFGDVETALAEKQDEIDALVEENSAFKKQISTAHISTTSTQLADSAEDLPIENVKIKGATSQVQYEGNQLVDFSDGEAYHSTYNFNNDTLVIENSNYNYSRVSYDITSIVKNNAGKTLKFSFESKQNTAEVDKQSIQIKTEFSDSATTYSGMLSQNYVIPADTTNITYVNLIVFQNNSNDINPGTLTIVKPMLQFGAEEKDYEPFVGRTSKS